MPRNARTLVYANLLTGLGALATGTAHATTWYVATSGSDSNAGTSTSSPFLTLQHAANMTQPGDTVSVMSGTYTAPCAGCDVVKILQSGMSSAPITYTAYNGTRPLIDTSQSWQGFHIDASFITVEGFEIVGAAQSVTMSQATAAASSPTYQTAGNGIQDERLSCKNGDGNPFCLDGSNQPCSTTDTACTIHGTTPPNHLTFYNNLVHDESGSGIEIDYADYVTVTSNSVYRNAYWSPYGQSGISLYELTDSDSVTSYKNYVTNNFAYSNQQKIATQNTNPSAITDGNGIIIDDNQQTQQTNGVPYNGRTFVANNVVSGNGGSGAHAYSSQHVDFVANTAYQNDQTVTKHHGQMFSYSGADINFFNNILTPYQSNPYMTSTYNAGTVVEDYTFLDNSGGKTNSFLTNPGLHDGYGNPQFANPGSGNFSLTSTSPTRGAATSNLEPTTDIAGTKRPQKHGYDTGAYESTAP